jgi:hypothetical protein
MAAARLGMASTEQRSVSSASRGRRWRSAEGEVRGRRAVDGHGGDPRVVRPSEAAAGVARGGGPARAGQRRDLLVHGLGERLHGRTRCRWKGRPEGERRERQLLRHAVLVTFKYFHWIRWPRLCALVWVSCPRTCDVGRHWFGPPGPRRNGPILSRFRIDCVAATPSDNDPFQLFRLLDYILGLPYDERKDKRFGCSCSTRKTERSMPSCISHTVHIFFLSYKHARDTRRVAVDSFFGPNVFCPYIF